MVCLYTVKKKDAWPQKCVNVIVAAYSSFPIIVAISTLTVQNESISGFVSSELWTY